MTLILEESNQWYFGRRKHNQPQQLIFQELVYTDKHMHRENLLQYLTVSICGRTPSKRAPSTLPRYKEKGNASLRSQNMTLAPRH